MGGPKKKYPPFRAELSRKSDLKYRWHEAITNLETKVQPYPVRQIREVIRMADWFVGRYGDWAEQSRMQPVHLLRNDAGDQLGRGLAWRWLPEMSILAFPRPGFLIAEYEGDTSSGYFVYRFDPDGRCVMAVGSERADILGDLPTLMGQPSLRERTLAEVIA